MGRASGHKAERRLRAEVIRLNMTAYMAEQAARPEIAALEAARRNDTGLLRRHDEDAPGQERRLLAAGWLCAEPGAGGVGCWAQPDQSLQMIHSLFRWDGDGLWSHLSFKLHRRPGLPSWEVMRDAHWLLYPGLFGVQVVAPPSDHVSISEVTHLWTRLDAPAVPQLRPLRHNIGMWIEADEVECFPAAAVHFEGEQDFGANPGWARFELSDEEAASLRAARDSWREWTGRLLAMLSP